MGAGHRCAAGGRSELSSRGVPAADRPHSTAGYDLSTEAGFSALLADFESVLGLHRLRAVHLNDSKSECCSPSGGVGDCSGSSVSAVCAHLVEMDDWCLDRYRNNSAASNSF